MIPSPIPLPLQIVLAAGLDALCGDPRWIPHPVQAIGNLALSVETPLRRAIHNEKMAGIVAVMLVIGVTASSCGLLLWLANAVHPLFGDLMAIALLYTTLAARGLSQHALEVQQPLANNDLATARTQVGMLVGRDTDQLNEAEITRATVESVAENTVDAVTAPLLFALLGGPVGAMVYKAINTLDSTFGYKNERYLQFGWASARLDDLANFIPARLSAVLVPVAAKLLKLDTRQSWTIMRRDRHNHPSPNGGQIEAAMAGALNVRLGGENSYFGKSSFRPYMGESKQTLCSRHIGEVIHLMWLTSVLVGGVGMIGWLAVRFG